MSTRRNSRQAARRRATAARRFTPYSLYRRALRIEPLEDRRLLAVVTINTLSDTTNLNDNLTTLREAIFATNLVPGADFIDFAPSISLGGQSKIVLTQGPLTITDSLTIDWPNAGTLTIDASGNDPTPTVKNGDGSRAFTILRSSITSVNVKLSYLSITGADNAGNGGAIFNSANLTISDCEIFGNSASDGGGVYSDRGAVLISTSSITNNRAGSSGGGVLVSSGDLNVVESKISGNAGRIGGGLRLVGGEATILDSSIDHNTAAGGVGGGISAGKTISDSGRLTITRSTIDHNSSGLGGGIDGGNITVDSSTISNNMAGKGAGIYHTLGGLHIVNSTVSGNQSIGEGGGGAIYNFQGGATIRFSTITQNSNGLLAVSTKNATFRLFSTIITGNLGSDLELDDNNVNTFQSDGFNIVGIGEGIGAFNKAGDQTGVLNPLLGPLADNGGPTFTHALLPGSPAINAGDFSALAGVNGVPQFDQRGTPFGRVFNGRIDIGAFEYQQPSDLNLLVDTLVDENDGNFSRGDLSLREAIALANLWPSVDTIHFDAALITNGPAKILLTQGELKITSSMTIAGLGADLLTIDASGNDPTPTIVNGDGSRIFNIDDGVGTASIVSISSLKLTGGDIAANGGAVFARETLTLVDMVVDKNYSTSGGGVAAVVFGGAKLTISQSIISNNQSKSNGGGISLNVGPNSSALISESQVVGNSNWPSSTQAINFAGGGIFVSNFNPTGTVTIEHSDVVDNVSDGFGGGISAGGALTIKYSTIARNSAQRLGGGMYFQGSFASGSLTLSDSEVADNRSGNGGGIAISGNSTNIIARSTISDNTAEGFAGGGIYSPGGQVQIMDSTVSGNTAANSGGGIYSGAIVMERTTVSDNIAANHGGGLALFRSGTIRESTITGNSAKTGGALYATTRPAPVGVATVTISYTTIAYNKGTSAAGGLYTPGALLSLDHSIVAQNVSPSTSDDLLRGPNWPITAAYSLIGDNNGSGLAEALVGTPDANGNLIGGAVHGLIDPRLGPLADNGGPTFTHALLPGSPAINAGDLSAVAGVNGIPQFDQRGTPFGRVFNGRIDIGAFEYQQPSDLNLLVDTLVDENDGNYSRGDLSLREAIALANAWSSFDTIHFDPALTANGPAKILLTRGELFVGDAVSIVGPGRDLLSIDASGNDSTPGVVDGRGSRIFDVASVGSTGVAISNLRLTGGDVPGNGGAIASIGSLRLNGMLIDNNAATGLGSGGGVYVSPQFNELVRIENSTITGNLAHRYGGGVGVAFSEGNVEIYNSTISNNGSFVSAGGLSLYLLGATKGVVVVGSTISDNNTPFDGGGIRVLRGNLTLRDSIVSGNSARNGAGIAAYYSDQLVVERSTIADNQAAGDGGGVFFERSGFVPNEGQFLLVDSTVSGNQAARGGGVFVTHFLQPTAPRAQVVLTGSTVSGNGALGNGGGLWIDGDVQINHSTVTQNTSDTNHLNGGTGGGIFVQFGNAGLDHTILAGNHDNTGVAHDIAGVLNATRSIVGFGANFLGPLADNGGPTKTHSLLPNSPAINAGDPAALVGVAGVPRFDQRGTPFTRVYGGRIDIGAVEFQPNPLPGDFDLNGVVDASDYTLWRNSVGSTTDLRADGNGDGMVDNADYALWRANFGHVRLPQFASTLAQSSPVAVGAPPINSAWSTANRDLPRTQAAATRPQPAAQNRETSQQASNALLAWLSETGAARKAVSQLARDHVADHLGAETVIEDGDSADALDEAFATLSSD